MKKLLFIASVFLFSCSWQEYFVIENNSKYELEIIYDVESTDGFPIFQSHPSIHPADGNRIDWSKQKEAVNYSRSPNRVHVKLPAGKRLVFGNLSNDKYEKYNQYFINDRKFNLQRLKIFKTGVDSIVIVPETFDSHFRKKDGIIKLPVS